MKTILILHDHPETKWKIEQPSVQDVLRCMQELITCEGDSIEIMRLNNHMFLEYSANRWLVRYSGVFDENFVNAILTDPDQSTTEEIIFNSGGQRVDYLLSETVSEQAARKAAIGFIETGIIQEFNKFLWHLIDKLPLSDD